MSFVHWLVISLSLGLTLFAWWYSSGELNQRIQLQFDKQASQVVRLVVDRMQKYEDALWAGVSFIHASDNQVNYLDWRNYVNSLDILSKYPGINGVGVIYRVKPDDLQAFLNAERKLRPSFHIHPVHKEAIYLPITYITPLKGNEKAVGLDMAFEKNRFTSAVKAERTGSSQMTGPIILVQDKERTPGFLLYAPFYSKARPITLKEREETFLGMVYAPFIMKKLMSGALEQAHRDIVIKILDKNSTLYNELHSSNSHFDPNANYRKVVELEIYGRTWTFHLWSDKSFAKATTNNQPKTILLGGVLIDALLLVLFLQISWGKEKAVSYANKINRRLDLAMKASQLGVWEYHIESQDLFWEEGMFPLYGVKKENFSEAYHAWEKALHPDDKDRAVELLNNAINNNEKFDTSFRIITENKQEKVIRALASVIFDGGKPKKVIGVNWDISNDKEKEAALERLAKIDALSQLRNCGSFNETVETMIKRATSLHKKFALLIIDVDDFKQINDLYGHQVGDEFITIISVSLRKACRDRDVVFRLGGDEFAIISDFLEQESTATTIAERVITSLRKPYKVLTETIESSCSIGIAVFPQGGDNSDELMMNADIALYKSKEEGKNCINFFSDVLNKKAKRFRFIKNNLEHAINNNEFFINYQPIVDARTGKTTTIEALARWKSDIGLISPDDFIQLAEQNNHINPLGKAIATLVFNDAINTEQNLKISINCSSKQLLDSGEYATFILEQLDRLNLPPKKIIIEITESYLIRDFSVIKSSLDKLLQCGIDIAIDDFGTGYSSLSLLANIPFQYLKIDREFANNLLTPTGYDVLKCIYNVSKSFKAKIIVEGVETLEQKDKLLEMGVYLMQGYYFSKPVPITEIKSNYTRDP